MDYFKRIGDELYCENVKVAALAKEYGTPLYIYSKACMCDNCKLLFDAFQSIDTHVCYSVKSNGNLSLLRIIAQQGAGADIVSGGELFRVLKAGIDPKKIVFSGVGKTADELRFALQNGIGMFNIESESELMALSAIAQSMDSMAPIALRINPDIDAYTHQYTTTGKKGNKFGLPLSQAIGIYKKACSLPGIHPIGIDVHLGSPILSLEPYQKALELLARLVSELLSIGISLSVIDIGGGFGIIYQDEKPFTPIQLADLVIPYWKKLKCRFIIEPGRFIVGNAGILVTTITYVKKNDDKLFYICDTGMNDLIRPPLYGSFHSIVPVTLPAQTGTVVADIVGPICESADFFAKDRPFELLPQASLLAIRSAGAYGFSMSSQYNARPRACEVLVDGSSSSCIRRRETFDDLIRQEI